MFKRNRPCVLQSTYTWLKILWILNIFKHATNLCPQLYKLKHTRFYVCVCVCVRAKTFMGCNDELVQRIPIKCLNFKWLSCLMQFSHSKVYQQERLIYISSMNFAIHSLEFDSWIQWINHKSTHRKGCQKTAAAVFPAANSFYSSQWRTHTHTHTFPIQVNLVERNFSMGQFNFSVLHFLLLRTNMLHSKFDAFYSRRL